MIPNPKKQIVVDFSTTQVKEALLRINNVDSDYKLNKTNEIMKLFIYSSSEFLSLGVYIDVNYKFITETSTEINIEVRRVNGAFDKDYEVSKANRHIEKILEAISSLLENPNKTNKKKRSFFGKLFGFFAWGLAIIILFSIPFSPNPWLNVLGIALLLHRTIINIFDKFSPKK